MTVTAIEARTVVTFHGQPQYVWSSCDRAIVAWACVSCDLDFPTRQHLAEHVKADGSHLVGRACVHGLEAPAPRPENGESNGSG